jgi:phosphoenolpyruvate phosphomutase
VVDKACDLRARLDQPGIVRVIGAYDGMSAILGERHGFDALWASGLAISAAHGVPDASILTMTELLAAAEGMNRVCGLPVIADCDTGFGGVNNIVHMVREYERAGIAAVCIEDKEFPKRNSFLDGGHLLADVHEFAAKVRAAKLAQVSPHFMVIARVESLVVGASIEDALARACVYRDAGADAILVHSKAQTAEEIGAFAAAWRAMSDCPLVVVPTTYYAITCSDLLRAGVKVVIYANHSLRAAVQAMSDTLAAIREAGSTAPIEAAIGSVRAIFDLTGTGRIAETDAWFERTVAEARQGDAVAPLPRKHAM